MSSRGLYCHYFHTDSTCKKNESCSFTHGEKLESCPNGSRCPIRVRHTKIVLPTSDPAENAEREEEEVKVSTPPAKKPKEKKPKITEEKEEKIPPTKEKPVTIPKPVILEENVNSCSWVSNQTVNVTLSSWDNDIITVRVKKPEPTQAKSYKVIKATAPTPTQESIPQTIAASIIQNPEEPIESYQERKPSAIVLEYVEKHFKKASNSEKEFLFNFLPMQEDMQKFLPIYRRMFPQTNLDLMFLVDCTGSMSSWIEAVKLEISGIVAAIRNNHPGCTIRLSFIGYRDYGDKDRYEVFKFSTDLDEFTKFVSAVEATGGNDAAEDVAGGFLKANQQNWVSTAKYAVLLADAPAHGREFHKENELWYDRFLTGDPDNVDLEDQFKILIRKGVKLYAVEIMPSTQIMFDKFKKFNQAVNGKELDISKLGYSTSGFGQYISQTASQTLSQSYTAQTAEDPQGMFFKALKILQGQGTEQSVAFFNRYDPKGTTMSNNNQEEDEEEESKDSKGERAIVSLPLMKLSKNISNELKGLKEYQAVCHTYFIVQDKGVPINWRKPLVQNSSIKTKIIVAKQPFAEGAMRYAFLARDTLLQQDLVAKVNKKQYKEEWTSEVSKNKDDMVRDLESQFICQHIVNDFNSRITAHVKSTANLKNFVHCFIYQMTSQDAPFRYYSAENYISGEYVKFNNNAGWSNMSYDEPGLLSQALSHFSYQLTEGYLMVVDLQGVGSLLTDPQIHCLDQKRFGAGNLGYQGMFKFFVSHECNKYCNSLHLNHPNQPSQPKALPFYTQKLKLPDDVTQKVFCMCDLCKKPFETIAGYVYSKTKDSLEKYCNDCDKKKSQTMKSANCTKCKAPFRSSTYWFLMKRTDFPELCGQCRRERRDQMRSMLK